MVCGWMAHGAPRCMLGCIAKCITLLNNGVQEEMREGSDLFTVHAYLPAEASFGFADELRRRSSGAATASLMLSHWERLQVG